MVSSNTLISLKPPLRPDKTCHRLHRKHNKITAFLRLDTHIQAASSSWIIRLIAGTISSLLRSLQLQPQPPCGSFFSPVVPSRPRCCLTVLIKTLRFFFVSPSGTDVGFVLKYKVWIMF